MYMYIKSNVVKYRLALQVLVERYGAVCDRYQHPSEANSSVFVVLKGLSYKYT